MKKTVFLILLTSILLMILPLSAMAESIDYIDENGKTQTADCTVLTSADDLTLESGEWYAVKGEVKITNRVENKAVNTNPAHLILVDGCQFSVPKGIHNPNGTGLVLYGQTEGSGECKIDSVGADNAGIGGNSSESAGLLTINGGTVTVSGCNNGGACIGGGGTRGTAWDARGGSGGEITINGGTVTANAAGAYSCTGIGGGSNTWGGHSGTITINGGTVTAIGSYGAYGIGPGIENSQYYKGVSDGNCDRITINGGLVTVNGLFGGEGGVITVNDCARLETDKQIYGKEISITNSTVDTVRIRAYQDITIKSSTVTANGGGINTDQGRHIRIEDSTVTAITYGATFQAAIGGPSGNGMATNITIIRSKVTASACWGAGIGSDQYDGTSLYEKAGNITITDSIVNASSQVGAGIGGGKACGGGNVIISGSTVLAYSSGAVVGARLNIGAGIGAGDSSSDHGSLSIDETAYEIVSGSSSSQEYRSLKSYMSAPNPYVIIHPVPTYTVKHSGMTLDGKGYETLKTEAKQAHAGAQAAAIPLTFEGFAFARMDEAKPVADDGSTVVNVYYDRLSGTLVFTANGHGIMPDPITAPFGTVVKKPDDPKATGYVFDGWYEDKSCTKAYRFATMPTGVKVVYAKWTAASSYKIIKGANQIINSSASSAVFASDAPFSKFVRLEIDGKTVGSEYYTAKSGSTVITLNEKYISTLKVGSHTLEIVSKGGSASTGFEVIMNAIPQTGDNFHLMLWTALLLASTVTILLISAGTRKRKED